MMQKNHMTRWWRRSQRKRKEHGTRRISCRHVAADKSNSVKINSNLRPWVLPALWYWSDLWSIHESLKPNPVQNCFIFHTSGVTTVCVLYSLCRGDDEWGIFVGDQVALVLRVVDRDLYVHACTDARRHTRRQARRHTGANTHKQTHTRRHTQEDTHADMQSKMLSVFHREVFLSLLIFRSILLIFGVLLINNINLF